MQSNLKFIMSVLTYILAKLKAFASSDDGVKPALYPHEEFEKDVMDEVVELKTKVNQLSQIVIMQQTQLTAMQTFISQFIGQQYENCSVINGNSTTINNNNYYAAPPQNEQTQAQNEQKSVYPRQGDYISLVEWLEEQKAKGIDYYAAAGYNRSKMCRQLSDILGWEVDQNSLRKAENR